MIRSFLFIIFSFTLFGQTIVPIANLHDNDSTGFPKDTTTLFRVRGVVTASKELGNSTSGPGAVQDGTAGISVYGSAFATAANLQIGDTVIISAKLGFYNGLSQLDFRKTTASSVTKVSAGVPPEPMVVTIPELKNQQWNGYEQFESRLVRINNVRFIDTTTFAPGASGKTYTITDSLNTFDFRLTTQATGFSGIPIPRGKCDIIGVISQFKSGAPFNSGYQIMARSIADIIADGRPLISNNIIVNAIDTSAFTVIFETVRKGNSQIKYGKTQNLELDSVVINEDTTIHKVRITGLQKNTLYYFKAYSANAAGMSISSLQQVTTASGDPATGTINVYFNNSVDTSVAMPGNAAKGNADFTQVLIKRINAATYSLDMALYSFNGLDNITTAILSAKNRGVKIRMVYDYRSGAALQASVQTLVNAGIKISQRQSSPSGLMHNKFYIFDGRDGSSTNDWVVTGSWNATTTELTWKNNIIEINDSPLIAAYTKEFEEMWGSNTDTPNPTAAKFGSQKADNTPHSFTIGGRPVKLYFSPSDGTTSQIINTINTAEKNAYIAIMAFTRDDIALAFRNRFNAGANDIRGVMDDVNGTGSEFTYMKAFADFWANPGTTLHSKYLMVDATLPNSAPTVLTGSHNWSAAAENSNDENTLIITDLKIANQYMQEFKKRYNEAGGTGTFIIPSGAGEEHGTGMTYSLYQNYPNPFNPVTTIRFDVANTAEVKIEVFNALGQSVGVLFNSVATPGGYAVDFNSQTLGKDIPSGIYFYRFTAGNLIETRKMMLLK